MKRSRASSIVTAALALLLALPLGLTALTTRAASPVRYAGVNLAGADFGEGELPGVYGVDYTYPTNAEVDYFVSKGMNTFRLPFRWERLQRTLNGSFDTTEFGRLDSFVSYATSKGANVLLDPHNYARYNGQLVGTAVPNTAFADFWSRLANLYKGNSRVIFGLMNEPNTMPTEQWRDSANAAIAAIRAAGATNLILVPGNAWTGAHSWNQTWYGTANAVAMLGIRDSGNNFAFDVHQYLDSDSSGTATACVSATIGSERLATFTSWLKQNGKRGFLGEFGGGRNDTCYAALDNMLAHIDSNSDVWLGWTYWAAGPWWADYIFTIEPNGADRPQMVPLGKHLPPSGTTPTAVPTTAVPTRVPTTAVPTTAVPTRVPTTAVPTTAVPTRVPTTAVPTTAVPTSVPGSCTVAYMPNQWNTAFTADVKITNQGAAITGGWTLTWTFPGDQHVTSFWNTVLTQSGQQVTAKHSADWNANIPTGGSQSFGFQASFSGTNVAPTNFALNGKPCNGGSNPTSTPAGPTATPTRTPAGPTATPTRTPTPTVTPTSNAGPNNVLYLGRFNTSDPAGPKSAWSATTIKANFTGTSISANLISTGDNWYNVVIDGVVRAPVHVPAGTNGPVALASGLASGNHTIELVRRTEASIGEVQFKGFTAGGGQLLAPPTPSARRIELIGDSITAGYGNEGANQYQTFTTRNENAYLAYGSVAARALGADQLTVAWSGKGVIRNYGGDTTDVLPSIYSRILPYDTTTLWNPSQWIPQVVVINLGTNDFSIGAPDKTAFTTAYANFARRIRSQYPNAHIYCALGPMLSGNNLTSARDYITTVVNQLNAAGDTKVRFIEFPTQDGSLGYGEDWHPSVAQHAAMANLLVNRIKTDLGW